LLLWIREKQKCENTVLTTMGLFASGREETHVKSLLSVSGVWIDRVNNMSFQHFPVLVFIMYQTGQTNPMGI
jgi:hypothetical protein